MIRAYFRRCFDLCFPTSLSAWIGWYLVFVAVELATGLALKADVFTYAGYAGSLSTEVIIAVCVVFPLIMLLGFRFIFVAPYLLFCNSAESGARNRFPQSSIVRTREDSYCIMLAVAGFNRDEITITEHEQTLYVAGRKADSEAGATGEYPRGYFGHPFERRFNLGPDVQVKGASLDNGLLRIEVQEQLKPKGPRRIDIRPLRLPAGTAKIIDRPKVA